MQFPKNDFTFYNLDRKAEENNFLTAFIYRREYNHQNTTDMSAFSYRN